jgi:hypothetical protein
MRGASRGALRQRAAPGPGDLFRAPAAPTIDPATPDQQRLAIRLTCRRPELRPMCPDIRFAVDRSLDLPFRVTGGERIVLHPACLAGPVGAALSLRHALELALWQRLGGPERGWRRAMALLACRVAALYGRVLPAGEREAGLRVLPEWLRAAYRIAARATPDWQRLPAELQRLDGGEVEPQWHANGRLVEELRELAAPSEHLLIGGGGSRLRLDPATGRNMYGCGALPSPDSLAFASSTASAISAPAYRAVEALRQAVLRAGIAGQLASALAEEIARAKREILARCGVADLAGTEVILTPSGTDGEYAALHLAGDRDRRPVNIVIAPDETGSGVLEAAQGRHFASETPQGDAVAKGTPLSGQPERLAVETVAIRDPDGAARSLPAIDGEVAALVRRAVADGARCLVHLLDASKSGLTAPSLQVLERLCACYGDKVEVVVDACQMRLSAAHLRGYLERGWMVLVTGSKFTMGPPFAGALLVPARLAAKTAELDPLPPGFAQYFTRPEWPAGWQTLTGALPQHPNLGLLFRWRAALFEMQALEAVPDDLRHSIIARLGGAIRDALDTSPLLEAVEQAARDEPPTIFPFLILRSAGKPMAVEATRQVWRWLREDLSERLPAAAPKAERRLGGLACQVGQPIPIGPAGALRICIGAHLIAAVAFDPALGNTVALRLERQIGRARLVLDKAALIARYFDDLCASTE